MERLQKRFKIESVTNESPTEYNPVKLSEHDEGLTDVTPKFLVGSWVFKYLDHSSKQFVPRKIYIDPTGKFTIEGESGPKYFLTRYNMEWSKRIITFDKRDISSGKTIARERLNIIDNGKLLKGEPKGNPSEKIEYSKE
jgi:hypothetical protein